MHTMVITGFPIEEKRRRALGEYWNVFFMAKNQYDKNKFVSLVINSIETLGLKFCDD